MFYRKSKVLKFSCKIVFFVRQTSIKEYKENIMKQLTFAFIKEVNAEFIIQFPLNMKKELIKQMAIALIKVNKRGGGKNNDKLTD